MWITPIILSLLAVLNLISAFFPNFHMRWGVHRAGAPMSIVGRLLTGIFFGYWSLLFLVDLSRRFDALVYGIFILLFVSIVCVSVRDHRKWIAKTRQER
jgi:hypothetical protein